MAIRELKVQIHAVTIFRAGIVVEPGPWSGRKQVIVHGQFINGARERSQKIFKRVAWREELQTGPVAWAACFSSVLLKAPRSPGRNIARLATGSGSCSRLRL